MPVQIYLAAGLAEMFGYSLSLLRVSTLMLLTAGLAALYGLLRRGSLTAWPAAVLTLGFLASPLVLMLSFTFMSDIQFTAWLLIALWLYSRGFESPSGRHLLLGSVAAACAIGTRQFGMALIAGVVVAWAVSRPARRPALRSLVLALTLPLAVSAWQLRAGLRQPQLHAGSQAARASVLPRPAALRHGSRDRLARVYGPAVPGPQPVTRAASRRLAVPEPLITTRRSQVRNDGGHFDVRALVQHDRDVGPADPGRLADVLVEELRHRDARERWSRLAAVVDAADGVLEQDMADARIRSVGRSRRILPASPLLALAGHAPPGARLALAGAPHRSNGPRPGRASSQLCAAQRHLSGRYAAFRSAAHRRRPGDSPQAREC